MDNIKEMQNEICEKLDRLDKEGLVELYELLLYWKGEGPLPESVKNDPEKYAFVMGLERK